MTKAELLKQLEEIYESMSESIPSVKLSNLMNEINDSEFYLEDEDDEDED